MRGILRRAPHKCRASEISNWLSRWRTTSAWSCTEIGPHCDESAPLKLGFLGIIEGALRGLVLSIIHGMYTPEVIHLIQTRINAAEKYAWRFWGKVLFRELRAKSFSGR